MCVCVCVCVCVCINIYLHAYSTYIQVAPYIVESSPAKDAGGGGDTQGGGVQVEAKILKVLSMVAVYSEYRRSH